MPLEFISTKFALANPAGAGTETKAADTGEISILGASFLNIDRGNEIIVPSAYSKHLERFSKNGKVLIDHSYSVRSIAAKVYRAYETGEGLVIDSKFSSDEIGQWARAKAMEGSIDTTSIGHYVLNEPTFYDANQVKKLWEEHGYEPTSYDLKLLGMGGKVRMITEAEPVEVSFVSVPMNPEARVLEVKSLLRDLEMKKGSVLNRVNRQAMVTIYRLAKSILRNAKLEQDLDDSQVAKSQGEPKSAAKLALEDTSLREVLKLRLKLIELEGQFRSSK